LPRGQRQLSDRIRSPSTALQLARPLDLGRELRRLLSGRRLRAGHMCGLGLPAFFRYFLILDLARFLCSLQTIPKTGAAGFLQPGTGQSCFFRAGARTGPRPKLPELASLFGAGPDPRFAGTPRGTSEGRLKFAEPWRLPTAGDQLAVNVSTRSDVSDRRWT